MLKKILFLLLIVVGFVVYSFDIGSKNFDRTTIENKNIIGPVSLNKTKGESISVTGSVKGSDIVFGTIACVGSVKLSSSKIANLDVVGLVKISDCEISGEILIVGMLKAKNSHMHNISITASLVELDNSKAKNITIKKQSEANQMQTLVLKGNTVVDGDIIFESGQGIVEKASTVKMNGSISGCTVVNK